MLLTIKSQYETTKLFMKILRGKIAFDLNLTFFCKSSFFCVKFKKITLFTNQNLNDILN